ncbi:paralysed flagella protein (pflA) [Campylobacterota bacterium]|nr:paralysed flagella protein (pflA) [Campylobacterota bacterium]GHV05437.1 paralysed flagella protein (pflA) [Campylobacterota bacterium]
MKKALLVLLLTVPLFALEITQTTGIGIDGSYQVLSLDEIEPFACRVEADGITTQRLICEFGRIPAIKPIAQKNEFFNITPIMGPNHFTLRIDFLHKAAVYPITAATLTEKAMIPSNKTTVARRYTVLGYRQTMPLLQQHDRDSLDFPVEFPAITPPQIGTLDHLGRPITQNNGNDEGADYARILTINETLGAVDALREINMRIDETSGRHLFMPELLALKIKILDKLGGHEEELISIAAPWVNSYTANAQLPLMLLLLGKAEMRVGLTADALYHYDTLVREYPESSYADFAKVYIADRALARGRAEEAQLGYQDVYFNSPDIPAASLAASRLAEIAILQDDVAAAADYYVKILQSNPDFFLDNIAGSRQLMMLMAEHKLYLPASMLLEFLLPRYDSTSVEYEKRVLDLARWQRLGGLDTKSFETYKRYLNEFPYAASRTVAKKEYDLLEFALGRDSDEANLELYDYIYKTYKGDEVADRALFEKAKLLLRFERYKEVHGLLSTLDRLDHKLFYDFDQQMSQTERILLDSFLRESACENAVKLTLERSLNIAFYDNEKLYECAYGERSFDLAQAIITNNLNKTSPAKGEKWLSRRIDIYYETGNLPQFITDAERYMRMNRALRTPLDENRYFQLFNAYQRLGHDPQKMYELGAIIETRFPKDPRLMDVYAALVSTARGLGETTKQYEYAKKLINRHRITHVGAFTPESELAFADAAVKQGKSDEAIVVLQSALDEQVAPNYQARLLFTLGELLEDNDRKEQAVAIYEQCSKLDTQDQWAKLCQEKQAM